MAKPPRSILNVEQLEERNIFNAAPVNLKPDELTPVLPEQVKADYGLDQPYYEQYVDVSGIPIATSGEVSIEAMAEAKYILENMLPNRSDIFEQLNKANIKLVISGKNEKITDIPEYDFFPDKDYWNERSRGFGPTKQVPVISVGEENVLNLSSDRWVGQSVLVHEMAHAVELAMNEIDPEFPAKLKAAFDNALDVDIWEGTYSRENFQEYWAQAVQCYFNATIEAIPTNGIHNEINTRDELKAYDPKVFALIDEVFLGNEWSYVPYSKRLADKNAEVKKEVYINDEFELPMHGVMVDTPEPPVKRPVPDDVKKENDAAAAYPLHGVSIDGCSLETPKKPAITPQQQHKEDGFYWRKLHKPRVEGEVITKPKIEQKPFESFVKTPPRAKTIGHLGLDQEIDLNKRGRTFEK